MKITSMTGSYAEQSSFDSMSSKYLQTHLDVNPEYSRGVCQSDSCGTFTKGKPLPLDPFKGSQAQKIMKLKQIFHLIASLIIHITGYSLFHEKK